MRLSCTTCSGEGGIYKSRYGGNDPDVWRAGDCEDCEGSGDQRCEARGCSEKAIAFNDDGEALCEDCLFEWQCEEFGECDLPAPLPRRRAPPDRRPPETQLGLAGADRARPRLRSTPFLRSPQ